MKEGVDTAVDPKKPLEMGKGGDKLHVLYGGTKMLLITSPAERCSVGKPPPDSCIIYALRTGFDTSQGKLMRCVERVAALNNRHESMSATQPQLRHCVHSQPHTQPHAHTHTHTHTNTLQICVSRGPRPTFRSSG